METTSSGTIRQLAVDHTPLDVSTDLRIVYPDWEKELRLSALENVRQIRHGPWRHWFGTFNPQEGLRLPFEQHLIPDGKQARSLSMRLMAEKKLELRGVYLTVNLSVAGFKNGVVDLGGDGMDTRLPAAEVNGKPRFLKGETEVVTVTTTSGSTKLRFEFDRPVHVFFQDGRRWGMPAYQCLIRLHQGGLRAGETVSLKTRLAVKMVYEPGPAKIRLGGPVRHSEFSGFGANYVFQLDSPVTEHTMQNLRLNWGRTQLLLTRWEPRNDNKYPQKADMMYFSKRASPGSALDERFRFNRRLDRKVENLISSVWYIPEWLYASPVSGNRQKGGRVPESKWDELAESITSYLAYQKEHYGVEPDYFTFNEPDLGVYVKFTPEAYARFMEQLVRRFRQRGIQTKLLVPDAARASKKGLKMVESAIDRGLKGDIGAVGFHLWHYQPSMWPPWRELANELDKPLVIGEIGADPGAWKDNSFLSDNYAVRELKLYQEMFTRLMPRAVLEWEATGDYNLLEIRETGNGKNKLVSTMRYKVLKQYTDYTPVPAVQLSCRSSHEHVLATAFRQRAVQTSAEDKRPNYTIHIANLAEGRKCVISGLPPDIRQLYRVNNLLSSQDRRKRLKVTDGKVAFKLPSFALTTLTTLPEPQSTDTNAKLSGE